MKDLNNNPILGIFAFGLMEIIIGGSTLMGIGVHIANQNFIIPYNVFLFIWFTALISMILGLGLLLANIKAYRLMIFFASVVIISKLLIFTNIVTLHRVLLEVRISTPVKDIISLFYHLFLLWYFKRDDVRRYFKA
ncbi:hypothetical protein ACFL38_00980 [Candidatus Omnitrophota bacterium]